MKKSPITIFLFIVLSIGMIITGCSSDKNESTNEKKDEKSKVIKIGKAPYDYEAPVLEVTKQIMEEQGYEVEVVEGDVGFMFLALEQGDIDIWPGVWLPSIHESYHEKYKDSYELGSAIFEDAPIGIVVPSYVEVDSMTDLKGNEDIVDNKLVGFEPGSGMMIVAEEVIEGYDLDLELVSGTLSSMMAEADYSITHEEPILFLGWRPHVMFRNYDLKVLEDPKGFWGVDSYYWGINKDFESKSPEMYHYVKNFKMSIDDNEAFLNGVQNEDKDMSELASEWIEDNRADIDKWIEK